MIKKFKHYDIKIKHTGHGCFCLKFFIKSLTFYHFIEQLGDVNMLIAVNHNKSPMVSTLLFSNFAILNR